MYYSEWKHYNLILNFLAVKARKYYCNPCNVTYRHLFKHECKNICSACNSTPSCSSNVENEKIRCVDCGRDFFNQKCFDYHKTPNSSARSKSHWRQKRSVCSIIKVCDKCFKMYNLYKTAKHECGKKYCQNCKSFHGINEFCYMQSIKKSKTIIPRDEPCPDNCYIFYDFETRQDVALEGCEETFVHKPNLCIAQLCCDACANVEDINKMCSFCGVREHVYIGDDCLEKFLNFVIRTKRKNFSSFICIAHNAKAFDSQFILKYIIDNKKDFTPKVILNGRNIIKMQIGLTRFIDSLNYLPMKLSCLPKTFGLPEGTKKGYFPHLFNTKTNEKYKGPYPAASTYSPDSMSSEERDNFYKWYNDISTKNLEFDMERELVEYCRQDVSILRQACMVFRKIFLEIGNVDPFSESVTIASACSVVFRKNFLKDKSIGILPSTGYSRAGQFSQKAIEWLLWQEKVFGKEIIHAGRSREFVLDEGPRVDGYLKMKDGKGIVFQFHGCFYHGCPRCFEQDRDKSLTTGKTFAERFENTKIMSEKIKSFGYELIEIWECDFDRNIKENAEFKNFIKEQPAAKNIVLNPRDAFYGGRTGNVISRYTVKSKERIHYLDVCSLYPFVCKTGTFPVGHPKIYTDSECFILTGSNFEKFSDNVEGLVKCDILPPRNLFHPVLPIKMHDKLLFSLCRTCTENMQQSDCNHENIEERVLSGTWVSIEIKKALECGYKIIKIYVIWQYEVTKYDPVTKSGGLFSQYIDAFLKIKQESSGWPSDVSSEKHKHDYIEKYKREEGITLDFEKIEKNPGLRSVAKLCLNSFWGKFGQRGNLPQTSIIRNYQDLIKLDLDPEKQIESAVLANENVMYVTWKYKEECISSSPCSNVVIAAYTTAQARLELFYYLNKLNNRVFYYDTDSIIFISKNDGTPEYQPPTGSLLGQLTDEIECYGKGSYIETFVSGGPKFYAFRVRTPSGTHHDVCKVKGIRINYENSLKINFDSISDLIKKRNNEVENCIKINNHAIRRTSLHEVVTRNESKTCSVVLKKRRFVSDTESFPYGYKKF